MNKQYFEDSRFFILDSAKLEIDDSIFYGYTIIGNDVVTDLKEADYSRLCGLGAYVAVEKTCDEIILHQDFIGCYGIHLYEGKDGSFVVSNSFLYLVEYLLRNHYECSINSDYVNYFATTQLCSSAYGQTAVNEIRILDRCAQGPHTEHYNNRYQKGFQENQKQGIKVIYQ